MKIKTVIKVGISLIIIVAIVFKYISIYRKQPFNSNIDDVKGIYIKVFDREDKKQYFLEVTDKDIINQLVGDINGIRAKQIEGWGDKCTYATIYTTRAPQSSSFMFSIFKDGYVRIRGDEEEDVYKTSDKKATKIIEYAKEICLSDKNCIITQYGIHQFHRDNTLEEGCLLY